MSDCLYWSMEPNKEPNFDPLLRKATPLMKIIIDGMKNIFNEESELQLDPQTQLILSSCHGELAPTYEYLKDCALKDLARPFLFQNSLHHSTTGFISQYFKLIGPAYSLCGIESAEECALTMGLSDMMQSQIPRLFIHAEYFPEELVAVSDYEAIRLCHILYVGNQKVVLNPKPLHAAKKVNNSQHLFHQIADAASQKKQSIQVDFSKGASFEVQFNYN